MQSSIKKMLPVWLNCQTCVTCKGQWRHQAFGLHLHLKRSKLQKLAWRPSSMWMSWQTESAVGWSLKVMKPNPRGFFVMASRITICKATWMKLHSYFITSKNVFMNTFSSGPWTLPMQPPPKMKWFSIVVSCFLDMSFNDYHSMIFPSLYLSCSWKLWAMIQWVHDSSIDISFRNVLLNGQRWVEYSEMLWACADARCYLVIYSLDGLVRTPALSVRLCETTFCFV